MNDECRMMNGGQEEGGESNALDVTYGLSSGNEFLGYRHIIAKR